MSKILDALRRAESARQGIGFVTEEESPEHPSEFQVVTVCSNKGGVGKTTIASNLAVYLRALREDDPVLILGFDDQTTLDRMFALDASPSRGNLADGLRAKNLARVSHFGQYGVDYVPTCTDVPALRSLLDGPESLQRTLVASQRSGTIVIDTKSDFEILTRSAILVSDLTIVVVKDQASLIEAKRVFELLEKANRPRESARILLSLVDLRVKFREGEDADVLAHLLSEIRKEGYTVFETFISRSPKVESLYTNPEGRAIAILQGARQSLVHRQMIQLTREVVRELASNALEQEPDRIESEFSQRASGPPVSLPSPPPPPRPRTTPTDSRPPSPRKGPRFWGGMTSKSNP